MTQEDRIIINKAQITKDKAVDEEGNEIDIDDIDSIQMNGMKAKMTKT